MSQRAAFLYALLETRTSLIAGAQQRMDKNSANRYPGCVKTQMLHMLLVRINVATVCVILLFLY